jgi:hypothetical protein
MEPHHEDLQKALEPGTTPKPKRLRIVRLEERIAPSTASPAHKQTGTCYCSHTCNGYTCTPTCQTCYTGPCQCTLDYCW